MTNKFEITNQTPGFEELPEWWVSYDDSRITWRPVEPYLFVDDDFGASVVNAAMKRIQFEHEHGDTFIAAHPNVELPTTLSNPHTALLMLSWVIPFERYESFDDEDQPQHEYKVRFSKGAPKLIDIFGPSHDEFGNQIIY